MRQVFTRRIIICLLALMVISASGLQARQDGTLDASFGTNGEILITAGLGMTGNAMALQPDGKIVAGGTLDTEEGVNFILARYTTTGTLDLDFGTGGTVDTDMGFGVNDLYALALQPDGKIVVAGLYLTETESRMALARYNTDGSLDNSFGTGGLLATTFGEVANAIVIQPDGKIVVAGVSNNGGTTVFALARYNADGSPDANFGTNGTTATANFSEGSDDIVSSMLLQPDGKIVVAGQTNDHTGVQFAMARYNADGSLDNSFGTGGKSMVSLQSQFDVIKGIQRQSDGKIVAVGFSMGGHDRSFAVARFTADGHLDSSFGTGGFTLTNIVGNQAGANAVVLQPDGKIIAAGGAYTGELNQLVLVRYTTDGQPDNSFGVNGVILRSSDHGASEEAKAIALQPDGKIVVVGGASIEVTRFVLAVRYTVGISVGVAELPQSFSDVQVLPNPVREQPLLQYTLHKAGPVSIALLDAQGKVVQTLVRDEEQEAGVQQRLLALPAGLPLGCYFLVVSSPHERIAIKMMK